MNAVCVNGYVRCCVRERMFLFRRQVEGIDVQAIFFIDPIAFRFYRDTGPLQTVNEGSYTGLSRAFIFTAVSYFFIY